MTMIKALVKASAEPGLWLQDVPMPEVCINDVLIKILRTGICGTDVHIYNWDQWAQKTIPVPMIVGHEFVGEIVEVGSNVHDFKPGDIVSGEGHVVCGHCRNCMAGRRHLCKATKGVGVNRPGAFAEYLSLPQTNVWHHAQGIPRDIQAIFDPFGNAVHTALEFDVLGEDVLITGAGPIGIMAAAIVRHAGARHVVVTDVNPWRLELAQRMGVKHTVNVSNHRIAEIQHQLGMTEKKKTKGDLISLLPLARDQHGLPAARLEGTGGERSEGEVHTPGVWRTQLLLHHPVQQRRIDQH